MKTELRLGSVISHGVGGPEAGGIDLIYTFLLAEYGQNFYKRIGINQVGDDLDELIIKEPGNKIHVNIRYPIYNDFESKTIDEKNKIRLDVVHVALLRIADHDKKLEITQLEKIRKSIIDNNFEFDFICKSFVNKKNKNLVAKITVRPEMTKFDYFACIEEKAKVRSKIKIYSGLPNVFYFPDLFYYGKWANDNQFIINGKQKEVEIRVLVDENRVEFKNLTRYAKPPLFEMMRADISPEEHERAARDWRHSLEPSVAAIIRQSHN